MQTHEQHMRKIRHDHWLLLVTVVVTGLTMGCGQAPGVGVTAPEPAPLPTHEQLRQQLDEQLEWTFQNRRLNLEEHAAWQILHGALAFQRQFLVQRTLGGESVSAVDHLLQGGLIKGWTVRPGIVLDEATDRRGLIAILESGTKQGQGHSDQWLAVLAQCDLEPTQPIQVGERTYTMADFVSQVQWDCPRNVQREFSWTLIGLTTYQPTTATWKAQDGQTWSIERLVEIEIEQDVDTSACGGTHRLIGLAMALNRHLASGGIQQGVWADADGKIVAAIQRARELQNPNGSFSANYFQRAGQSADLAKDLGSTGHVLEFLVIAMTDKQLAEPWVTRAVVHLCDLLRKTQGVDLECGALYHAAHGLVLYRQRVFGDRKYETASH